MTTSRPTRALLAAALLAGLAAARAAADGSPGASGPSGSSGASGTSGASGPSDSQTPFYDPADLNHDGTVTPRERRRYNRMMRGGHGAGGGASGAAGGSGAAPDEEASEAAAQAHSDAAGKSAAAAADALKSSLTPDGAGDMKPGGPGASGAAGRAAIAPGAKSSGDPSDPRTPADFALAARSGYAPAFKAAGLKLGPDGRTIVRSDGSPATAADYARLRQGILAMPAALGRRPDFFAAVSPQHYTDLKEGYRENPELSNSVYKHVGTTDSDRDFVHTASCEKLSGDCNENVEKPSYKKGDFVAPEDLDRMWGALQKELDSAEDPRGAPDRAPDGGGEERRPPAAGALDAGSFDGGGARASRGDVAGGAAGTPGAAPAAAAVVAARRLWSSAKSAIGLSGNGKDASPARGLGYGAAALAVLAAAGLALRGRG